MTAVLIMVMLLGLGGLGVWVANHLERSSRGTRLRDHLHRADSHITNDHTAARKAMNDAAGQSWRNTFE